MNILVINAEEAKAVEVDIKKFRQQIDDDRAKNPSITHALVVTGGALHFALAKSVKMAFLDLGTQCKAVVCCRVSPLQKALVTRLVKDNLGKITLSIGDGANDVSMIQSAHIGVGIRGVEGMQAALAADYTISQFRFLERLVLIHGRLSYRRVSTLVCYFFYKNIAFAFTMFWYSIFTNFSGQRLYDDLYQATYNLMFTALPVISLGFFERDIDVVDSLRYPELYKIGQEGKLVRFHAFSLG